MHTLHPTVETPNVAGAMGEQIDDHGCVDEVIIDQEVDRFLDVREFPVGKIAGEPRPGDSA
jgi:hypothetical protein